MGAAASSFSLFAALFHLQFLFPLFPFLSSGIAFACRFVLHFLLLLLEMQRVDAGLVAAVARFLSRPPEADSRQVLQPRSSFLSSSENRGRRTAKHKHCRTAEATKGEQEREEEKERKAEQESEQKGEEERQREEEQEGKQDRVITTLLRILERSRRQIDLLSELLEREEKRSRKIRGDRRTPHASDSHAEREQGIRDAEEGPREDDDDEKSETAWNATLWFDPLFVQQCGVLPLPPVQPPSRRTFSATAVALLQRLSTLLRISASSLSSLSRSSSEECRLDSSSSSASFSSFSASSPSASSSSSSPSSSLSSSSSAFSSSPHCASGTSVKCFGSSSFLCSEDACLFPRFLLHQLNALRPWQESLSASFLGSRLSANSPPAYLHRYAIACVGAAADVLKFTSFPSSSSRPPSPSSLCASSSPSSRSSASPFMSEVVFCSPSLLPALADDVALLRVFALRLLQTVTAAAEDFEGRRPRSRPLQEKIFARLSGREGYAESEGKLPTKETKKADRTLSSPAPVSWRRQAEILLLAHTKASRFPVSQLRQQPPVTDRCSASPLSPLSPLSPVSPSSLRAESSVSSFAASTAGDRGSRARQLSGEKTESLGRKQRSNADRKESAAQEAVRAFVDSLAEALQANATSFHLSLARHHRDLKRRMRQVAGVLQRALAVQATLASFHLEIGKNGRLSSSCSQSPSSSCSQSPSSCSASPSSSCSASPSSSCSASSSSSCSASSSSSCSASSSSSSCSSSSLWGPAAAPAVVALRLLLSQQRRRLLLSASLDLLRPQEKCLLFWHLFLLDFTEAQVSTRLLACAAGAGSRGTVRSSPVRSFLDLLRTAACSFQRSFVFEDMVGDAGHARVLRQQIFVSRREALVSLSS
ncbi:putative transmembrane protein [Toxoplasma gondii MAS]|uniref:Putative transmembrane protein n=1 Tax=Toxoplasma gondii MAS TaxID=943118 RepID=A0A086QZJ1_TOXGO|nr:putative transmembrane protein [Toxoplasma gondii MAS]